MLRWVLETWSVITICTEMAHFTDSFSLRNTPLHYPRLTCTLINLSSNSTFMNTHLLPPMVYIFKNSQNMLAKFLSGFSWATPLRVNTWTHKLVSTNKNKFPFLCSLIICFVCFVLKQFENFPSKTNNKISSLLSSYTRFMEY